MYITCTHLLQKRPCWSVWSLPLYPSYYLYYGECIVPRKRAIQMTIKCSESFTGWLLGRQWGRVRCFGICAISECKKFKQECISVGCVSSASVAVSTGGGCLDGGWGGCLPHAPLHAGIHTRRPLHAGIHTHTLPLLTEGMTHTCENITFAQLLLLAVMNLITAGRGLIVPTTSECSQH